MADLKKLELFLLRYVPVAVREEFINIGLILLEADRTGFAEVRFAPDWRAAERIDPQVDTEMSEAIVRLARRQFQHPDTRAVFLKRMEDSFSNLIQLSPMRACLAEDPAKEIEALSSFYFKAIHQPTQRVPSGRNRIWQQMRAAFEEAGILGSLMTDIAMEQFTQPGDPLKLDFAYRVRGLKVFQAVSLSGKLDQANYFGSRAKEIIGVVAEKTGAAPFLTAVVNDDWDRNNADAKYAEQTMIKNQVEVAVLAEMPKIAERARLELSV
ncbi:MAG: DUF3037 domain-containing protein [Terriglobales bacterium]